jgi:hypothetical protein
MPSPCFSSFFELRDAMFGESFEFWETSGKHPPPSYVANVAIGDVLVCQSSG